MATRGPAVALLELILSLYVMGFVLEFEPHVVTAVITWWEALTVHTSNFMRFVVESIVDDGVDA